MRGSSGVITALFLCQGPPPPLPPTYKGRSEGLGGRSGPSRGTLDPRVGAASGGPCLSHDSCQLQAGDSWRWVLGGLSLARQNASKAALSSWGLIHDPECQSALCFQGPPPHLEGLEPWLPCG